jgi:hypothetical protein
MRKWIITFLLGLLYAQGVSAMGFLSKPTHCVFSAVSGHVTLQGEPVKNARLVRTGKLGHAEKAVVDETITDSHGYFEFPDMYQSASEFGILVAFTVTQTLFLHKDDGEQIEIWQGGRWDAVKGGENRKNPWHMKCELTNDIKMFVVNNSSYFTRCEWDVEQDPTPPLNNER